MTVTTPDGFDCFPPSSKSPQWLTQGLTSGDLYYTSPTQQFLAKRDDLALQAHAVASTKLVASLFADAHAQGIKQPLLFGLLPFDLRRKASFTIPRRVDRAPVPTGSPTAAVQQPRPQIASRTPVPAPEIYGDAVRQALTLFAEGGVDKIVLARAMDLVLDGPLNWRMVLEDLIVRNRHGYTFAMPAWKQAQQDTLLAAGTMLGASPELLVRREGRAIVINPLAGSIGRHSDPAIDQARREGLAVSEKDLREHAYVVDDIVRILRPYCSDLTVPAGPSVIGTDALWHLSTLITGTLADPETTALDLSCALHPTPAICGHPTAQAFKHISELESFEREYFAGLVGWQQEDGDGEWALTLRCAFQFADGRLRLYAGAGTVAGSDPEAETLETATKMETFMRAIA